MGKNTYPLLIIRTENVHTFAAMKRMKIFFTCALMLFLVTCKKDSSQSEVQYVLVDYYVYLSQPQYGLLNTVGNWAYIPSGVRGIVVYHQSPDVFIALERNCTFQPSTSSAVVSVDSSNVFLADTSCGSKFYLTDGSVAHGPATVPLKQYHTSYNSTSMTLHIYN